MPKKKVKEKINTPITTKENFLFLGVVIEKVIRPQMLIFEEKTIILP